MKRKITRKTLVIAFIIMLIIVPVGTSLAYEFDGNTFHEDWVQFGQTQSGLDLEPYYSVSGVNREGMVTDSADGDGHSWELRIEDGLQGHNNLDFNESHGNISVDEDTNLQVHFSVYFDLDEGEDRSPGATEFRVMSADDNSNRIRYIIDMESGEPGEPRILTQGFDTDIDDINTSYPIQQGQWYNYTLTVDYDDSITLTDRDTGIDIVHNDSFDGYWNTPTDRLDWHHDINGLAWGGPGGMRTRIDNVTIQATNVVSENFVVDVDTYMDHNSTQSFSGSIDTVFLDGSVESQDVETTANSNDTSLITVDNQDNTLTSTGNTGYVNVTFTNSSYSETVRIFVGAQTIGNIEDLPPEQYIPAALGFGDTQSTSFGMGSEIQWVFLAILIGSMASWKARNEYIGIGVIIALIILFWINDSVSLGIVLVALFYGIFIGYLQKETPSRSDTNVGGFE